MIPSTHQPIIASQPPVVPYWFLVGTFLSESRAPRLTPNSHLEMFQAGGNFFKRILPRLWSRSPSSTIRERFVNHGPALLWLGALLSSAFDVTSAMSSFIDIKTCSKLQWSACQIPSPNFFIFLSAVCRFRSLGSAKVPFTYGHMRSPNSSFIWRQISDFKFLEMIILFQSETSPQVSSETHSPSPLWFHLSI